MPTLNDGSDVECAVIGAGVVGLAIARALALAKRDVVVLEAAEAIGTATSSRNSEVIHAGIYYPAGSLKAQFCRQGRDALYQYCRTRNVPFRQCGKMIVAADASQSAALDTIEARARVNGVANIVRLDRAALRALEPQVEGAFALLSPSTGIVDSHAFMLALQGEAEAAGAMLAFNTPVVGAARTAAGLQLYTGGTEPARLVARHVILAAGLFAPSLAAEFSGINKASIPRAYFCKGTYFAVLRLLPFSRLVYPVPEPGGFGIHLTLDLAGRARFGPDVEWLDCTDPRLVNYDVDPGRAAKFRDAIRRYWPGLRDEELVPAYTGIRPKIAGPGEKDADFAIHDAAIHGLRGLIALYGIESPGLTSALAIADHVAGCLDRQAR
jgi:L-2-hydroxyglutarate oxidase LhgO